MKKMSKNLSNNINKKDIEKLLAEQTNVILFAVDERLRKNREDIKNDTRLEINKLANTLDKFLKRLTDFEDEFEIMKAKVSKMEKFLQTRLGLKIS